MTPYYEHAGQTIFHGDCRDVIEQWEGQHGVKSFDLLLTDPPYGIGVAKTGRVGSGRRTKSNGFAVLDATDFGEVTWDGDTCADVVPRLLKLASESIIFGGNYYALPPSRCWLVWDKDNAGTDFADAELAWTNLESAVRLLRFRWNGMLQGAGVPKEPRLHPTMKPGAGDTMGVDADGRTERDRSVYGQRHHARRGEAPRQNLRRHRARRTLLRDRGITAGARGVTARDGLVGEVV